ncbi:MAG: hypothetical protein RIB67_04195 [Miltoncostaeaceae bacterium]
MPALAAALVLAGSLTGCGGDADGGDGATTGADAPRGAEEVVTAYFDRFTDDRPDEATALMSRLIVRECGGSEGMLEAIAEARAEDEADYRITEAVLEEDGDPPRVMARLEVQGPGSSPGTTRIPIGVLREDGGWRLAELHPAGVALACRT